LRGDLGGLYDAIEQPRRIRGELPILSADEVRPYLDEVRERTLEVLDEIQLEKSEGPLLRGGFVYEMLLAHEHQHNETMLQLLQLVDGYEPPEDEAPPSPAATDGPETVRLEAGSYEIGAGSLDEGFSYDNERRRHAVELTAFEIDRSPVTNAAFAEFLAATDSEPPQYWRRDGSRWVRTAYGREAPPDPAAAVVHVDFHQAEAFAEWAGKRLPSEQEWEAAHDRLAGLGQVWEWTSSEFTAYPGFEAFPYREYSEAFFDQGYEVLRGGSWAAHPSVLRPSFRNWDLPQRRQIFAGIRCARDA
jgi:iron(II)-dependent oxidoreductase